VGTLTLRPSVLRADGWEVFEVALRRPRAVHPMWWTADDFYLYDLRFRLPGGRSEPVGVMLRRGEDPERFDLEPDAPPGGGGAAP
jgi:hypothetical protein